MPPEASRGNGAGPGPGSRPSGGVQADEPAASDDPWAHLQQQYRIDQGGAGGAGAQGGTRQAGAGRRVRGGQDDDDDDGSVASVEVLTGGGAGLLAPRGRQAPAGLQHKQAAQSASMRARAGYWGEGDMAKKGTLMVGEEEAQQPARAGAGAAAYRQDDRGGGGGGGGGGQGRGGRGGPAEEQVAMEDIEDLVESELEVRTRVGCVGGARGGVPLGKQPEGRGRDVVVEWMGYS
jgi:hypothetical protein